MKNKNRKRFTRIPSHELKHQLDIDKCDLAILNKKASELKAKINNDSKYIMELEK